MREDARIKAVRHSAPVSRIARRIRSRRPPTPRCCRASRAQVPSPLVVWRALTLVSRNEPLFVEFFCFFLVDDGVSCSYYRSETAAEVFAASGLETLASSKAGLPRPGSP